MNVLTEHWVYLEELVLCASAENIFIYLFAFSYFRQIKYQALERYMTLTEHDGKNLLTCKSLNLHNKSSETRESTFSDIKKLVVY